MTGGDKGLETAPAGSRSRTGCTSTINERAADWRESKPSGLPRWRSAGTIGVLPDVGVYLALPPFRLSCCL